MEKIDQQTRKLIERCEHCESKRKDLNEKIENYSTLENQARHLNANYHEIHDLNRFAHELEQLIELEKKLQGFNEDHRETRKKTQRLFFVQNVENCVTKRS